MKITVRFVGWGTWWIFVSSGSAPMLVSSGRWWRRVQALSCRYCIRFLGLGSCYQGTCVQLASLRWSSLVHGHYGREGMQEDMAKSLKHERCCSSRGSHGWGLGLPTDQDWWATKKYYVSNQQRIEDRSTRIRGRKQGTWERKNRSRHHGWFLEEEEE
jgi:hypothetical protein